MKVNHLIKKYNDMSSEKKSVIWYAICNVLQKGVVLLTTPIITRLLTTEEYGTYAVFLSWRDIFIIFATLNLFQGVFTKMLVDNRDRQDECASSIQSLGWCFSFGFAFIYLLFSTKINILLEQSTLSMLFLIIYFFFFPPFSLWCAKQRVNYKYRSMVVVTIIITILTPCCSIMLLYLTDLKATAVIIGSLIIYIIAGIYFAVLNIIRGKKIFVKIDWIFAIKYNVPLIPHYLSMIVLAHSDIIMIKYLCDEGKAGLYSLAYQVASMMNILYVAINNSFVPRSYEMLKNKSIKKLNEESIKLLIVMGGLTLCAILVAPEIVGFMGGEKYKNAIYIIPPVCTALFVTYCYSFFNNIEFYFSKTKKVMIASSISAVSNIVLNYIFISMFGYVAAGYTTLISYLILAMLHFNFSKKISIHEFTTSVYDWKEMFGVLGIVIGLAGVLLVVYNHMIVRYLLVVISLIIIIVNRQQIMLVLKRKKQL